MNQVRSGQMKCQVAERQWSEQLANAAGQSLGVEASLQKREPWWWGTFLSHSAEFVSWHSAPSPRGGPATDAHTHKVNLLIMFSSLVETPWSNTSAGETEGRLMEMRILFDTEFLYIKTSLIREHYSEHRRPLVDMVLVLPRRHYSSFLLQITIFLR